MELGGRPKCTMVPMGKYSVLLSLAAASVAVHGINQSCAVFLSYLNLDHVNDINHVEIYWIARNQPIHCDFILRGYNCQEADETMPFEFDYELKYDFWI